MEHTFLILWLAMCMVLVVGQLNNCDAKQCRLPFCRCPGTDIPGALASNETPQMVLFGFDDAVNWENWEMYLRLFPPDGSRRNPSGAPISMTLYVSHRYTDYCMIRRLYVRGMEIAVHSLTHRTPIQWWKGPSIANMRTEILGQKMNFIRKAGISEGNIRGWRSPFLQPSGDKQFRVLSRNNFTYDASMTYTHPRDLHSPVLWPFTLDYPWTMECNIYPCPREPYPGFWVVPVVTLMDYRGELPCSYVDFCDNKPHDEDETYSLLWQNLMRTYNSNRAPFYVNMHSPWLETPYHLEALDKFILKLLNMTDVYIVTVQQALAWIQDPTPLSRISSFTPWQRDYTPNKEEYERCGLSYKPGNLRYQPGKNRGDDDLLEMTTSTIANSITNHNLNYQSPDNGIKVDADYQPRNRENMRPPDIEQPEVNNKKNYTDNSYEPHVPGEELQPAIKQSAEVENKNRDDVDKNYQPHDQGQQPGIEQSYGENNKDNDKNNNANNKNTRRSWFRRNDSKSLHRPHVFLIVALFSLFVSLQFVIYP